MVIFLLAALAVYLAWGPVAQWLSGKTEACRVELIAAIIVSLVLGVTLLASTRAFRRSPWFDFLDQFASSPEAAQAVLGVLAGVMCRAFPSWMLWASKSGGDNRQTHADEPSDSKKKKTEPGPWPLLIYAAGLSAVVLAALVAPNAPRMFDRLTAFETFCAKFQLLLPITARQQDLDVQRDLTGFDWLDELQHDSRFIQYDCGYKALAHGGITELKQKFPEEYKQFGYALTFEERMNKFVVQMVNAHPKYNIEGIRGRVTSVAEKLSRLISHPILVTVPLSNSESFDAFKMDFELGYEAVKSDIKAQEAKLKGVEETFREPTDDRGWCDKENSRGDDISADQLRDIISHTRFVHGFGAELFLINGDTESAIKMMALARAIPDLDRDINVNGGLAEALYAGGRDLDKIAALLKINLKAINEEEETAKNFYEPDQTPKDKEIQQMLAERYRRARLISQRDLAYLYAQERQHLVEAEKFVKDAYKELPGGVVRFPCIDDFSKINSLDTYAYVHLAIEDKNIRINGTPPDQKKIQRAQRLLDDAMAQLNQRGDPGPCKDEERPKLWRKILENHLKLAELLLR